MCPRNTLLRLACSLAAILLIAGASATAWAQQVTVFSDNFTTLNTTNWTTRQGLTGNSVYSNASNDGRGTGFPNFPTGNTFHFSGNGANRLAVTRVIGLNPTLDYVTISFDLKYETVNDPSGDVQDATPFEDVDNGEEIVLEYSTGGGYTILRTFQDTDTSWRHWATATINVPSAAFTSTTRFRWRQLNHSGTGYDHWAIDNVRIVTNPEPGTWALFGIAVAGLTAHVVRRRRANAAARAVPARPGT